MEPTIKEFDETTGNLTIILTDGKHADIQYFRRVNTSVMSHAWYVPFITDLARNTVSSVRFALVSTDKPRSNENVHVWISMEM